MGMGHWDRLGAETCGQRRTADGWRLSCEGQHEPGFMDPCLALGNRQQPTCPPSSRSKQGLTRSLGVVRQEPRHVNIPDLLAPLQEPVSTFSEELHVPVELVATAGDV